MAKAAANTAVQYLAKQRALLRPAGEAPTPQQRQVERDHDDWLFNVRTHANSSPLHVPPVAFVSTPLTEQDVIGLFHELVSLGVFAGIKVYATSQSQTYDSMVRFECDRGTPHLAYSLDESPLGLSPFVLGNERKFATRNLTLEFKNNLDGLILDVGDPNSRKTFGHMDICVCWSVVGERFRGFELTEIVESNLDLREFPGATHVLIRDGDVHRLQVVMLKAIIDRILAGQLPL